jgi:hypothetical protein
VVVNRLSRKKIIPKIIVGGMAFALISLSSIPAYAQDSKEEPKTKSIEIVPETAVTVLKKVNAFFTGDLTWTMPAGKSKYKDDYTLDPQGNKIPSRTLGKYDDGVR